MRRVSLFVGIGSPHGDDQAGWCVAEEVRRVDKTAEIRVARAPFELLMFIEGFQRLLICDACHSNSAPGTVGCWKWPDLPTDCVSFCGTHDFSLPAALELADRLDVLPPEVLIWGIQVQSVAGMQGLSTEVLAAARSLAVEISAALSE